MKKYLNDLTGTDSTARDYYLDLRNFVIKTIDKMPRDTAIAYIKKQITKQGEGYHILLNTIESGKANPDDIILKNECESYFQFLYAQIEALGINIDEIISEIRSGLSKNMPFTEPDNDGYREWTRSVALLARSLIYSRRNGMLPIKWIPSDIFRLINMTFKHNGTPIKIKTIETAWSRNEVHKKIKEESEIKLFANAMINILLEADLKNPN